MGCTKICEAGPSRVKVVSLRGTNATLIPAEGRRGTCTAAANASHGSSRRSGNIAFISNIENYIKVILE